MPAWATSVLHSQKILAQAPCQRSWTAAEARCPGAASNPQADVTSTSCTSSLQCIAVGTYPDKSDIADPLLQRMNGWGLCWSTGCRAGGLADAEAGVKCIPRGPGSR